jgi:hypothetical protein
MIWKMYGAGYELLQKDWEKRAMETRNAEFLQELEDYRMTPTLRRGRCYTYFLKCTETRSEIEGDLLCKKWLEINEKLAYRKNNNLY